VEEIQSLVDDQGRTVTGWSMDCLHSFAFPTLGANVARTQFDQAGIPVETILEDDNDSEAARISYECDDQGRIRRAVERTGPSSSLQALLPSGLGLSGGDDSARPEISGSNDFGSGKELARMSFWYTSAGHLARMEADLLGQITRTTFEYNDEGDVVEIRADEGKPTVFAYEYDHRHNWLVKKSLHPGDGIEEVREITYFDD
jgi:hypothetical protein